MKLGAEDRKKVYVLIGLGVVAAYFVYSNLLSGPSIPAASAPATAAAAAPAPNAPAPASAPAAPVRTARAPSRNRGDEFHPVWSAKRPEDRPDPREVDPTIHWDLFAKVQEVPPAGGSRNLFQFTAAPPKEAPKQLAGAEPIVPVRLTYGPKAPAPPPPPPPAPPPPPIPLKFYGYSTAVVNGRKTAYFMDGDEIFLAAEGDTLKKRYKVVRIGPNAAVIEDLDVKRQQSVPLTEEGQG